MGASERNEEARAAWRDQLKHLDARELVVIDECGSNIGLTPLYARAPKGQRAFGSALRNRGKNTTLIAALTFEGMSESMLIEGAANGVAFEETIHFRVLEMQSTPENEWSPLGLIVETIQKWVASFMVYIENEKNKEVYQAPIFEWSPPGRDNGYETACQNCSAIWSVETAKGDGLKKRRSNSGSCNDVLCRKTWQIPPKVRGYGGHPLRLG